MPNFSFGNASTRLFCVWVVCCGWEGKKCPKCIWFEFFFLEFSIGKCCLKFLIFSIKKLPRLSRYENRCYSFAPFGTLHRSRHHWRFLVHPMLEKKLFKKKLIMFPMMNIQKVVYDFGVIFRVERKARRKHGENQLFELLWYAFWLHANDTIVLKTDLQALKKWI